MQAQREVLRTYSLEMLPVSTMLRITLNYSVKLLKIRAKWSIMQTTRSIMQTYSVKILQVSATWSIFTYRIQY